jgi:hypothetical protein
MSYVGAILYSRPPHGRPSFSEHKHSLICAGIVKYYQEVLSINFCILLCVRKRDHLEKTEVDARIILKWKLKN